jgi:WD40 repeat protein
LLASASDDSTVRLWDPATGVPVGAPLEGHADIVLSLAFSPDGRTLASGSKDGSVLRWDVASGEQVGEPLVQQGWVNGLAYSSDGALLASASHLGGITLWDPASGRQIGEPLLGHSDWVNAVAFDPEGDQMVSVSADGTLIAWPNSTRVSDRSQAREHLCSLAARNLSREEWETFVPFRAFEPTCPGLAPAE